MGRALSPAPDLDGIVDEHGGRNNGRLAALEAVDAGKDWRGG